MAKQIENAGAQHILVAAIKESKVLAFMGIFIYHPPILVIFLLESGMPRYVEPYSRNSGLSSNCI